MRDRILGRVAAALASREGLAHPGAFPSGSVESPLEAFTERFRAAGGEVERFSSVEAARSWLAGFSREFEGVALGAGVPPELSPELPQLAPAQAPLGVSQARFAAADTGSLVLDSRGGRLAQLLPPTHLVWVSADRVLGTLGEALGAARDDLPAALALHSGPSKSADIGRVIVTGVHGPGRVIAAILG